MFLALERVLSTEEAGALRDAAAALSFGDGRASAGRFAQAVKANDQALPSPDLEAIRDKVTASLMAHPVFGTAARPKAMTRPIISRYRQGQAYGLHVDDAVMQGIRTDLSFTLFLSEPDSYEGGALIIADKIEERAFKLGAGDAILYPSTMLHRVEPVSSGTRLCAVGWVQSRIRSAEQRELLFDLDQSITALFEAEGKSDAFDTLCRTRSNLIRMWAD
ncbi:Fe2+-dependent dioxygenase [Defluviimonas sp. WL0002]|uniref:Fe2+-dependent dioxygenase n=1 Tax=Albidovulum marisflavi TaxID=2984159 RepID=A0ABT2ZHI2_9RHOB|nr:Fe2+-dependent dioxygenase [Defluviimonas sp. WL0002]MCV2870594.1 Fe2+-dependent dioxygenase [Defluviimonas sp. WL0002]